jgi:hypothetical protein
MNPWLFFFQKKIISVSFQVASEPQDAAIMYDHAQGLHHQ